jgi:hypothetical protein
MRIISPPFFKEGCPDEVGRGGCWFINVLKIGNFGTNHPDWASPSKFDFVRILPPLLEKERKT